MLPRWLSGHARIRAYWCVWLVCVVLALALRFSLFAHSNNRFTFEMAYMIGTWLPIMVLNFIEGQRLMSYLKSNHHEKWSELTYVPGFGSGGVNSFRTLPWLYSRDDLGDPAVASLKQQHRDFIRWTLTVFLSYVVLVPVLLF
jgi:hypothetical protein